MSNASESASMEDGDESMLFNDGFSIVDDINIPTASVPVAESPKETEEQAVPNGKQSSGDVADSGDNTKGIVSDKEVKSEENISKDVIEEVKNNPTTTRSISSDNKSESSPLKTPSSSTLMITNDVDLGSDENSTNVDKNIAVENEKQTKVEVQDDQSTTSIVKKAAALRKKNEASFVWVSNITKQIKASSLKKHFAECGKVSTAKVVTNGKVFFGYVEFEVADHATACVKTMNNTVIEGRKILVTRTRPDVTKKPIVTPKKIEKTEEQASASKTQDKPEPEKVEPPKTEETKKDDKPKTDSKESSKSKKKDVKSSAEDKKTPTDDKKKPTDDKKTAADDKKSSTTDETKKPDVKKDRPKEQRSRSADRSKKIENELKRKLNDSLKKISRLRTDLDRTNLESNNLRRRLNNEQRRTKAEEVRGEKYKSEARTLSDQLKQSRADYEKETQRLIKKHKLELEKVTYQRESFIRKEEELKRRQDELKLRQEDFEKEFKRLEEAKRAMEHLKRSRKSRSVSPPSKRYRGRDDGYPERKITPPPPKLSIDLRSKNPTERIPSYYEEKKPKPIYNRLGDYEKEHYVKESNGRHRSGYAGDVDVPKTHWSQTSSSSDWKKSSSSASLDWKKPSSSSSDWKTPSSGSMDWKKPSVSTSDWKTTTSASLDWKKPSSGSADWKPPSSGSSDWKTPSSGSLDWKAPSSSSLDWKKQSAVSPDWKKPSAASPDWKKSSGSSPDWKKSSSNSAPKGYMERFGSMPTGYQMPSPFFSSGPSYFKHGQFENSRKH